MKKLLSLLLLSASSFAGAPIIWNDGDFGKFLTQRGFLFNDLKSVEACSVDPSIGGGLARPLGSVCAYSTGTVGQWYLKTGAGDTDWRDMLVEVDLASNDVVGVLPIVHGGTNASSFTSSFLPYFNGTSLADSVLAQSSSLLYTPNTSTTFQTGKINVTGGASSSPALTSAVYSDSSINSNIISFLRSRGSAASPTVITATNQSIGSIRASAYDGTNFSVAGQVLLRYDGSNPISSGVVPGKVELQTANVTTGTLTTGLSVDSSHNVNIPNLTASLPVKTDASKNLVSGTIVNADVDNSAGIDLTKLAATTASRALVSDASGFITPATTTATEIGYVNGVTSSIQTQLNAKSPTLNDTGSGETIIANSSTGQVKKLIAGSNITLTPAADGITIDSAGGASVQGARNSGISISAGTTITPVSAQTNIIFVIGNGGPVTVTATPPISVTSIAVGTTVKICGIDDANTVTYTNGSNLKLNGDITLGKDDCLTVDYLGTDGTSAAYVEMGRNN